MRSDDGSIVEHLPQPKDTGGGLNEGLCILRVLCASVARRDRRPLQ